MGEVPASAWIILTPDERILGFTLAWDSDGITPEGKREGYYKLKKTDEKRKPFQSSEVTTFDPKTGSYKTEMHSWEENLGYIKARKELGLPYTTAQIQEVIIQSVQLTVSRTAPFTLTGPYGTGKSTIITRTFSLLRSKEQFDVRLITLHRGVTRNWLIRKIAEAFNVKTARSYSQTLENVQIYSARVDQTKVVPTLIIDDGHFMDDECLSSLYSLLNAEDNKITDS
jgi:ATPase subunit of ABC transporter with duplicated ATPase domains